jgi:arginyl-tRNA synthetase
MILYNLNREAPWFFHHIENYYHLFLNIRFNNRNVVEKLMDFSIEFDIQGFEGIIFYMYKPHPRKLIFDIYNHSIDQTHEIKDLDYILNKQPMNSIDFAIIPFGYFKDEHKFRMSIRNNNFESSFDLFSWGPSKIYKNVKSVIKIDNQYKELIPIDDFKGFFYQVDGSFKGNETGRLFDLINHLVELDKSMDEVSHKPVFEPMDLEIKTLVSKTNEFLFELCQKTVPLGVKNIIKELERLKFNIDNLSKEEIFNWLDDLIDFYSRRE